MAELVGIYKAVLVLDGQIDVIGAVIYIVLFGWAIEDMLFKVFLASSEALKGSTEVAILRLTTTYYNFFWPPLSVS